MINGHIMKRLKEESVIEVYLIIQVHMKRIEAEVYLQETLIKFMMTSETLRHLKREYFALTLLLCSLLCCYY